MNNNKLPIGIFDSGLGGLSVVKQLVKLLPNENIIYLGDNARVPYGGRSRETVTKFSLENANFLKGKKVKCILIACNTSSALAGSVLKEKLNVPVFDVISPVTEFAGKLTTIDKIAVIGTRGTINSQAYPFTYQMACPLLVPFIEEGDTTSDALKLVVKNYLSEFKKVPLEILILGCTHYPLIKPLLQKEIGKNIKIIDPGVALAQKTKNYLSENNLLNDNNFEGSREYYVTDLTDRFVKTAEMFLGDKIKNTLKKVTLPEI